MTMYNNKYFDIQRSTGEPGQRVSGYPLYKFITELMYRCDFTTYTEVTPQTHDIFTKHDIVVIKETNTPKELFECIERSLNILTDNGYIIMDNMFPYQPEHGALCRGFIKFRQVYHNYQCSLLWDCSYGVGVIHKGEEQSIVWNGDTNDMYFKDLEDNFIMCMNPVDTQIWLNSLQVRRSKYKYSVLTCIFDDYEMVREVINPDPDVEYVLITDDPTLTSNTWNIKLQDSFFEGMSGYARAAYVKYHPFEFIDSDVFLWVDGSIQITDNFSNSIMQPFIDSEFELLEMINTISDTGDWEINRWLNNETHGFNKEQSNLIERLFPNEPWMDAMMVQTTIYGGKNTRLCNLVNNRTWDSMRTCAGTINDIAILYMPQRGRIVTKYTEGTHKVYYIDCSELFGRYFTMCWHKSNESQISGWINANNDLSKREGIWGNYRPLIPKKYSK